MRRSTAGYTLIEVMTAVVIMIIGATGILAMQGASVHANQDAHETSVAINFATTWMERLKRDARLWQQSGNAALNTTAYLQALTDPPSWVVPSLPDDHPLFPFESAAADYQGFDTRDVQRMRYCVNVRFTVAHVLNTADIALGANALRADLRVWWPRSGGSLHSRLDTCLEEPLDADEVKNFALRRHHLSTVLMSGRAP